MNKEKLQIYSHIALGILAGGIIFLVGIRYVLPIVAPFLIAWLIAELTDGPARAISKNTGRSAKVLRLIMSLILAIVVFLTIALLLWQATAAAWRFLNDFGEGNELYEFFVTLTRPGLIPFGDGIPEELAERISSAIETMISTALSKLATAVTSWVGVVPGALLFLLVTAISLVYFSLDLERINGFASSHLPKKVVDGASRLTAKLFTTGGKYIRSYIIIMMITFVVILVGLLLLGVKDPFLTALVVSALDILPIIGVGTALLPWSIFSFATGDHTLGVGLIVLYVVNVVVRQLAEPRIVGKSLDMHPVVTLILLYSGYALFGFLGLILVPVISVILGAVLQKNNSPEVS